MRAGELLRAQRRWTGVVMVARYVVGIDLGTTNTVVASARLDAADAEDPGRAVEAFPVPQLFTRGPRARQTWPRSPSFQGEKRSRP